MSIEAHVKNIVTDNPLELGIFLIAAVLPPVAYYFYRNNVDVNEELDFFNDANDLEVDDNPNTPLIEDDLPASRTFHVRSIDDLNAINNDLFSCIEDINNVFMLFIHDNCYFSTFFLTIAILTPMYFYSPLIKKKPLG